MVTHIHWQPQNTVIRTPLIEKNKEPSSEKLCLVLQLITDFSKALTRSPSNLGKISRAVTDRLQPVTTKAHSIEEVVSRSPDVPCALASAQTKHKMASRDKLEKFGKLHGMTHLLRATWVHFVCTGPCGRGLSQTRGWHSATFRRKTLQNDWQSYAVEGRSGEGRSVCRCADHKRTGKQAEVLGITGGENNSLPTGATREEAIHRNRVPTIHDAAPSVALLASTARRDSTQFK